MDIIKIIVSFSSIYENGEGFNLHDANKWNEFWKNNKFIFWKHVKDDESDYLVSTNTGGIIHPEGFTFYFVPESDFDMMYIKNSFEELKDMFDKLIKYIGHGSSSVIMEKIHK